MNWADMPLENSVSESNSKGSLTCDVSVIVATLNRRKSVRRLLESLSRQTLSANRFQVLLVSDGSTDGTVDMVRRLKARFPNVDILDLSNRGPAAARNAGARAAQGRYLAFTDDDCIASEDWLEKILYAFERTGAVAVQGRTSTDHCSRTPLTHQIEIERPWVSALSTCNAAYLKSAFDAVGGFDESFKFAHNEDRDLVWRVEELGKVAFAREVHIIHPPRRDHFCRIARRVKIFESDFLLYYKNRDKYRKYISSSPWFTIYWMIFVVQQLSELRSNCRYFIKPFKPLQFFIGLALICMRWLYLAAFFPAFFSAQRFYARRYASADDRLSAASCKQAASRPLI